MYRPIRFICTALAIGVCAVGVPRRGLAQSAGAPGASHPRRLQQTRTELESRLRQLEEMASQNRGGLSDSERAEAAYIRSRLDEGDFHVGDRILIAVEDPTPPAVTSSGPVVKSSEQQLSDTFTVGSSQELTLPVVGVVPLHGVLRTELESRLAEEVARYIRNPVVHVHALVGLAVTGELTRPGYYSVPADAVIPTVLMAAGGTTHEAKLQDLKIRRSGKTIWEGDELRGAIAAGSTVDDLGLRPGDVIVVPRTGAGGGLHQSAYLISVLLGIPVTIYTLTRIFK